MQKLIRVASTKHLPSYIHFTLQKTNRETQDALAYLSRQIGCQSKDLGIAGTKDKRAVTVQRVSIKRGGKTMESVWKAINGLKGSWNNSLANKVLKERAERGARVGDFVYAQEGLDLGLLKGNMFRITLRYVLGWFWFWFWEWMRSRWGKEGMRGLGW